MNYINRSSKVKSFCILGTNILSLMITLQRDSEEMTHWVVFYSKARFTCTCLCGCCHHHNCWCPSWGTFRYQGNASFDITEQEFFIPLHTLQISRTRITHLDIESIHKIIPATQGVKNLLFFCYLLFWLWVFFNSLIFFFLNFLTSLQI